ncbi:MAG: ParB/RepB/Spo0J family partition protein [Actinomycetota bacterium]|nr:ParB/RepB/Spo0J family partition protein [Actinomycetota bacterium]
MGRPSGLGRGLSALIPSAGPGQSGLINLTLTSIVPNPRQPRAAFDDRALEELAHSLREVGVLQPVIVRPLDDGRYELVAGERRLRAARLAGLDQIPAVVRHTDDADLLTEALVENIHRTDLNPLEEAAAYQQLLDDFGMTHDALAAKLGKSRSAITNALRLLSLAPTLQQRIASGVLSAGHARAILGLASPEQQERVAQRVVAEGLSVRATEDLVRQLSSQPGSGGKTAMAELARAAQARHASPYREVERRLSDALCTRVQIRGTPRRGKVVIDYAGQDDLERLLEVLGRGTGEDLFLNGQ